MKTRLSAFLSILIVALALAACGGSTYELDSTTTTGGNQTAPDAATGLAMPQSTMGLDDAEAADMAMEAPAEGMAPPVGIAPPSAARTQPQQPVPTPADMTFNNPGTNPFFDTDDDNLSTFAMDVDTASYSLARNYLMSRELLPPADAIRPEEFINYFDANYDSPAGDDAFAIYLDAAPAPFGYDGHYLMRVGMQGRYIAPEDRTPVFLTFVIDVSGSMDIESRLGLVKESLALLLDELREDDRVAIVVYSDNSRVVLEPTAATDRADIDRAIDTLRPEGSTNVVDGLRLGYQLARENRAEGENTRVVVLSDGVANVGITEPGGMLEQIQSAVDEGITLSTIGFGMGNFNDVLMEQLANDGNGNYYYVDNIRQARRIFSHNLTGTLQVIGYDAKVQVEFNAEVTDRYRLIGYENRAIADEDFRDDTVDAGEVGAGHSVTALYELALEDGDPEGTIATVYIRYEDAETREVVELSRAITTAELLASIDEAPATFRLHAAVAEFAELMRESVWAEDGSYGAVMALLQNARTDLGDADEDLNELIAMVEQAVRLGDQ
ncbi:MAG: vWA domain-containing protein [Chloroflexota bacterium]